ncbi:hypothetical protein NA78x_003426 [Anatilimnocola sp. NA78]|uniref:hypothetical protein n=1 Tax=Anatilimnocola sp. NA78 TaxID=3415683 RepID=UPI003CE4C9FC
MHLIQLLLPLNDNDGHRMSARHFSKVREELTAKFGGLTVYSQTPAEGIWETGDVRVNDEVVLFELMSEQVDTRWWANYRRELEERFGQEEIVIRAFGITLL